MVKAVPEFLEMDDVMSRFQELEQLRVEVARHVEAIQELYARIAQAVGGNGRVMGARRGGVRRGRRGRPGRRPGRPVMRAAAGGRRRAKRGALRAAIHKVLAGGRTARPTQILQDLPKAGYRGSSDPKILYNTVYLALRKDPGIEKTPEGFKLKPAAAARK